jgi:hypothetical protein
VCTDQTRIQHQNSGIVTRAVSKQAYLALTDLYACASANIEYNTRGTIKIVCQSGTDAGYYKRVEMLLLAVAKNGVGRSSTIDNLRMHPQTTGKTISAIRSSRPSSLRRDIWVHHRQLACWPQVRVPVAFIWAIPADTPCVPAKRLRGPSLNLVLFLSLAAAQMSTPIDMHAHLCAMMFRHAWPRCTRTSSVCSTCRTTG